MRHSVKDNSLTMLVFYDFDRGYVFSDKVIRYHSHRQAGDQSAATGAANSRPCVRPASAEGCRVAGSSGFSPIAVADAASGAITNTWLPSRPRAAASASVPAPK